MRHADGSYRWLLATGVPRYEEDGGFSGYIGCDVDITERKNAEDQIQSLAGRLIEAQEVERARIARDLHDDVSQQLAGVSIAFSGLKQRLGEYQRQRRVATGTRRASAADARPRPQRSPALTRSSSRRAAAPGAGEGPDFVLRRTWACTRCGDDVHGRGRFWRHHAGRCALRLPNRAGSAAERHRPCRRRRCAGEAASGRSRCADHHRGRWTGISAPPTAVTDATGLGLVSMSERARIIGGTVSIESARHQGTRVLATIPMNARVRMDVGSGVEGQVA